jgi:hypothetical protein
MMARFGLLAATLATVGGCSGGKVAADGAANGTFTKIDDMENGGDLIEWPAPPGMVPGMWTSVTDCTEAGNIFPLPYFVDPNGWSFSALPAPQQTFPGVVSTHAARLRTTAPLVGIWGAHMGFNFADLPSTDGGEIWPPTGLDAGGPDGSCRQSQSADFDGGFVDLSAYTGITFWAMADPGATKTIQVQINDRDTDAQGGICNGANPGDTAACYNGFGTSFDLTDTLTRYTLDFASLAQDQTWGYRPNPDVLDLQHVSFIVFQVSLPACAYTSGVTCAGGPPAVSFDFWIDDLYFVNK